MERLLCLCLCLLLELRHSIRDQSPYDTTPVQNEYDE